MEKYLHSSLEELEVGTILRPRENYKEFWGETTFYSALEKYRPDHMLAHHESVFFCTKVEDLDNCMEGEYLFEIQPNTRIERHDMAWSSKISCLLSENAPEEEIKQAALNYWHGVASSDPLWEYQTPEAKILAVYDYYDYNPNYNQGHNHNEGIESMPYNEKEVSSIKKLKL